MSPAPSIKEHPLYIDASMIKCFADCREQFRRRYIENKVPISIKLKFVFEIPKSRKELKVGDPHLQKPDIDNCEKGITDSLTGIIYKDDCVVWKVRGIVKVWGKSPRAEVEIER